MSAIAATPDPAAALLARVFDRILQWPCPECGQPFPCPCDMADTLTPTQPSQPATTEGPNDAKS
jgi:hypothetical protein